MYQNINPYSQNILRYALLLYNLYTTNGRNPIQRIKEIYGDESPSRGRLSSWC